MMVLTKEAIKIVEGWKLTLLSRVDAKMDDM